jgi:DNA replication protein DnaC
MIISQDVLQRIIRPKNEDSQEVLDLAYEVENEAVEKYGYNFSGITEKSRITRFVAREIIRKDNNGDYASKGLLLIGPCGRGKTFIANLISYWTEASFLSALDIDCSYAEMSHDDFNRKYADIESIRKIVIIDDLGAEPGNKRYGNEGYIMTIVPRLYQKWQHWGTPCVFTTNLDTKGIIERYDERTLSRLFEMCDVVLFEGNFDYRRK